MTEELLTQARLIAGKHGLADVRWHAVLSDWRGYVPDEIRAVWQALSDEQRALVVLVAEAASSRALDEAMSRARHEAE